MRELRRGVCGVFVMVAVALPSRGAAAAEYWVCTTNERSGDVTIIDGRTRQVVATVRVGKRPRGIQPSPDGRWLYVAQSGVAIAGPPSDRGGKGAPGEAPKPEDDDEK